MLYECSCGCKARYIEPTTQRLADRRKQYVQTSMRNKSNRVGEQPTRMCKTNNSKMTCNSAIGEHLIANPERTKTYTDDNYRITWQARSFFHVDPVYTGPHRDRILCYPDTSGSDQCL